MIRKGQIVKIKPERQDKGDDKYTWVAIEDQDGDRVKICPVDIPMSIKPVEVIKVCDLVKQDEPNEISH